MSEVVSIALLVHQLGLVPQVRLCNDVYSADRRTLSGTLPHLTFELATNGTRCTSQQFVSKGRSAHDPARLCDVSASKHAGLFRRVVKRRVPPPERPLAGSPVSLRASVRVAAT
jgi:hypothetical protein